MKDITRADYAVSKTEVDSNNMGWCVFDFVKEYIKGLEVRKNFGWYAYKLIDGVYHFKLAYWHTLPSVEYRRALKKDGYSIAEVYLQQYWC